MAASFCAAAGIDAPLLQNSIHSLERLGAGTDLASLKTKAVKDGDEWVINGQKMWTSLANYADYVWLAARTDPYESKKHKGLTMFLVPTDNPDEADVLLLNTCSIREKAQEKVFHQLGRWKQLKQRNPDLIIGVGGSRRCGHGAFGYRHANRWLCDKAGLILWRRWIQADLRFDLATWCTTRIAIA